MKMKSFIVIVVMALAAMTLIAIAGTPTSNYARSERYNERSEVYKDTLICDANGDTTAASAIVALVVENWKTVIIEHWHTGVAGVDSADTLEWQTRKRDFPGDSWSSWAILDCTKVPGVRVKTALPYTLRPYDFELRAIALVDTVGNKAVPHARGWSQ